jgi:hypothetical protein
MVKALFKAINFALSAAAFPVLARVWRAVEQAVNVVKRVPVDFQIM